MTRRDAAKLASRARLGGAALALAIATPLAVLATAGAYVAGAKVLARDPAPRLIGFDCVGASGPVYAHAESDFPPCRAIEPLGGRTTWAAIVEADGESDIVERGSLADCMAALARFDGRKPQIVTYCERESS